jgi:hypothetical protein
VPQLMVPPPMNPVLSSNDLRPLTVKDVHRVGRSQEHHLRRHPRVPNDLESAERDTARLGLKGPPGDG